MPVASFGSQTSTPGPEIIDLTNDSHDSGDTLTSKSSQDAPNIDVVGLRSISRTPFDAPGSEAIRETKPQLNHIKRPFHVRKDSFSTKPNGKVEAQPGKVEAQPGKVEAQPGKVEAQSAKDRRIRRVVNLKHLPSTIAQPRGEPSSTNCTRDTTTGPTASNRHVDVQAATIQKRQQIPSPVVPRKRKLSSLRRSSSKQHAKSISSSDSIVDRKSKVVNAHDRQARATIPDLLARLESRFGNRLESEDGEASTSTSTRDSYGTLPDHASGMLAARRLSQKALDLAVKEREAQANKTSHRGVHRPPDISKPTSSEKPSSAHCSTSRDIKTVPFDAFDNDLQRQRNAKSSFNLPTSFKTVRDDILRLWDAHSCQPSPRGFLSGSPSTPTESPLVEPLPGPSITASVTACSSSNSGDSQRNDDDATSDHPSETSADEHELRRRLLQQPFKLNFPPRGSSTATQDSDSDEGPRLRRRFNVKRYTFTKADFGYYSDDELPDAASLVDSETEHEAKISPRKPTGLRALFVECDPESDDTSLLKPYLSIQERRLIRNELRDLQTANAEELRWNGVQLHVPMSNQELSAIQSSIAEKANTNFSGTSCLSEFLKRKSAAFLRDISFAAQTHPDLSERSRQSVEAFLNDAARGLAGASGLRLGFVSSRKPSLQSSLLHQELGDARNSRTVRRTMFDSLQPAISFTGTSGDVGTVAWSPNGHTFAAGSACLVDPNSMQYNRRNNLLLGDSDKQVLLELPHHATRREKPTEGPNSTDAMHVTQDPRLFETVSMLDFSPDGNCLYSVGYDNFLRAYDASQQQSSIEPIWSYNHGAKVDLLAVSPGDQQLLATGCQIIDTAVNIFRRTENRMERLISLTSDNANRHTDRHILPSSIKWGKHPLFRHHLLAGFSSTSDNTESGELCMYDVTRREPIQMIPESGNVFDCAWSPSSSFCAAACTAVSHQVSRRTKSQVFIYRPDETAFKRDGVSLESSALDINDIVFCPYDHHYVAAGATDGKAYVWDIRRPDCLLHLFSHGTPLLELDGNLRREHIDTGVRFCAWSYDSTRLFSGSSDGVVKTWDIHRNPEDAHIQDVVTLNSGVMSGAFNADFTGLLLGEVNGSITVLEAGHESRSIKETNTFQLRQADDTNTFATASPTEISDADSGVALGRALRKSKQIKFKPLGSLPVRQAVQGRHYRGPYDLSSDAEKLRADAASFQARMKPMDKENICKIASCREANNFVTQEEAGDSGRSADRIPQALRDVTTQERADRQKMVPGMLKCSRCGRPARPRIGDADQELLPLCERCGFECFRCGRRGKFDALLTVVNCRTCGLKWRAGALGYNITTQRRPSGIGVMEGDTTRMDLLSENRRGLEDMGDLLHLVEDYYQSLWDDEPPADI